jgi:lipopolysaccharide biosynthesis regulator YciM
LHFALGNLFRRRGEYERAVRVHQHLLSRADLTQTDRDRAQYALAQDYLKAGLLDRAEDALTQLEGTAHASQAHLALLGIYERSRDWAKASAVTQKLSDKGQGSFHSRQAHYLCEQAAALTANQDNDQVIALLQQAIQVAPQGARARMALAKTYEDIGRFTVFPDNHFKRMFPRKPFGTIAEDDYARNKTYGIMTREEGLRITNELHRLTLPS